MKILAIETSCDETAISIVEGKGGKKAPLFRVLAHTVSSQIAIHKEWGGVVPMIAKREHSKALIPLLKQALKTAKLFKTKAGETFDRKTATKLAQLLEREPELATNFLETIPAIIPPKIDAIAVTLGPGLEPALWVGINFAVALSQAWQLPLIPINHMEGHIFSSLINENNYKLPITSEKLNAKSQKLTAKSSIIQFPAIALLISGGHTELVLTKDWLKYQAIGSTRDDAVGEAFDKVARLLGLPYPGGPQISRLAAFKIAKNEYKLPRPMLHSGDYDFSFSGIKTAVLYKVKAIGELTEEDKKAIAYEFEQAAIEVLIKKTLAAIKQYGAKALIIGGGVISNKELKKQFRLALRRYCPGVKLLLPDPKLSTDNATMIAVAAYLRAVHNPKLLTVATRIPKLKAAGNLSLA